MLFAAADAPSGAPDMGLSGDFSSQDPTGDQKNGDNCECLIWLHTIQWEGGTYLSKYLANPDVHSPAPAPLGLTNEAIDFHNHLAEWERLVLTS